MLKHFSFLCSVATLKGKLMRQNQNAGQVFPFPGVCVLSVTSSGVKNNNNNNNISHETNLYLADHEKNRGEKSELLLYLQSLLLSIALLDLCNTIIPVEAFEAFVSEWESCFCSFKQLDEV